PPTPPERSPHTTLLRSLAPRLRPKTDEAYTVVDERVASQDEEQQHALEHARHLVGNAEGGLRGFAPEIGQRQHQSGRDDAQRIEDRKSTRLNFSHVKSA